MATFRGQSPGPNSIQTPFVGYANFSDKLLVIEGDKGTGSGFLAKYEGSVYIFTNSHVLSGNTQIRVRALSGQPFSLGQLFVADKYDISRFSQTHSQEGIEILENLDSEVKIGDEVIVLGNSLGSGVVTELKGKVTGIGPELIEVDAKWVSGNSGSPIIHSGTKKVIGIATFSELRTMEGFGKDSKFNKTQRRFGYRLDNVPGWFNTSWQKFSRESATLNALEERTDDVWALAVDIANNGKIVDWGSHLRKGSPIAMSVSQWQRQLSRTSSSNAQLLNEKKRFISGILMTLRSDLGFLKPEQFTGFNREEFEKALKYRDILTSYFLGLKSQLSNDPDFYTR
jgi:hypothetical protein